MCSTLVYKVVKEFLNHNLERIKFINQSALFIYSYFVFSFNNIQSKFYFSRPVLFFFILFNESVIYFYYQLDSFAIGYSLSPPPILVAQKKLYTVKFTSFVVFSSIGFDRIHKIVSNTIVLLPPKYSNGNCDFNSAFSASTSRWQGFSLRQSLHCATEPAFLACK